MKTRILTLLISLAFLTSCSDNENDSLQREALEVITGTWNLKNVNGGLQGININYTLREVKWVFNSENNTLQIENNIASTGPEDIYAGLDSGTYNYTIQQNTDTQTLLINAQVRGVIILSNGILKIDNGIASDGFITEFKR